MANFALREYRLLLREHGPFVGKYRSLLRRCSDLFDIEISHHERGGGGRHTLGVAKEVESGVGCWRWWWLQHLAYFRIHIQHEHMFSCMYMHVYMECIIDMLSYIIKLCIKAHMLVDVRMFLYMHTHTHMYTYLHKRTCTNVYMFTHTHTHTRMHTHIYAYHLSPSLSTPPCLSLYVYAYIHKDTHI